MQVAFCGHRELEQPERVREWLRQVTGRLIGAGADCFLLGGYGEFDQLAAVARDSAAQSLNGGAGRSGLSPASG